MLLPSSPPPSQPAAEPAAQVRPFAETVLTNGLRLGFVERSNRYFGDYHRVCIEVTLEIALDASSIPDAALLTAGLQRFGTVLSVAKVLERLGVAGALVETVRDEMVASYLAEAQRYLGGAEALPRLLRAELARQEPRRGGRK